MTRIIIEGVKCSGKSSILQALKILNTKSTIIEYRAYFFENQAKYSIHSDCVKKLEWISRLLSVLNDDSVFLLRGHLFPFALSEAYGCGKNILTKRAFYNLDKKFSETNMNLILLTLDKSEFLKRNSLREKFGIIVDTIDKDPSKVMKMQDNYLKLFKKSRMIKAHINTTKMSISEITENILEKVIK